MKDMEVRIIFLSLFVISLDCQCLRLCKSDRGKTEDREEMFTV